MEDFATRLATAGVYDDTLIDARREPYFVQAAEDLLREVHWLPQTDHYVRLPPLVEPDATLADLPPPNLLPAALAPALVTKRFDELMNSHATLWYGQASSSSSRSSPQKTQVNATVAYSARRRVCHRRVAHDISADAVVPTAYEDVPARAVLLRTQVQVRPPSPPVPRALPTDTAAPPLHRALAYIGLCEGSGTPHLDQPGYVTQRPHFY